VITAFICWILVQTARQVLRRLMDGVDPAVIDAMEDVARGVERVEKVDWARARWVGHRLSGELAVTVDQDLTVAEGHATGEAVRHALLHALPHVKDVTVHLNPCGHGGEDPHGEVRHHHDR
jgi:divalent metal cation (Fe/Co/Zn/Cd) transporter